MLLEFIFVAIVLYLVDAYVPMQSAFKTIFRIGCVIVAIYYLGLLMGVSLPSRFN